MYYIQQSNETSKINNKALNVWAFQKFKCLISEMTINSLLKRKYACTLVLFSLDPRKQERLYVHV